MDPTACNGWLHNMIASPIICVNSDSIPRNLLVIPAILHVIPAQAGISARYRGDKIPVYAGMTV